MLLWATIDEALMFNHVFQLQILHSQRALQLLPMKNIYESILYYTITYWQ